MADRSAPAASAAAARTAPPPQTYANHRRMNPLVHFVLSPLLLVNLVAAIWLAARERSALAIWCAVTAAALLLLHLAARMQVLIVQNRLIRLEMSLRLSQVLPAQLAARVRELPLGHVIALRFAPDKELPTLVRRALAGELATADAIKRAIRDWQPDQLRA